MESVHKHSRGIWQRLFGRLAGAAEGKKSVTKRQAASGIRAVQSGRQEVAGRAGGRVLGIAGVNGDGLSMNDSGAPTSFQVMLHAKSGGDVRPKRGDFTSDEAYDDGFLAYQSAHMVKLRAQYADAWAGGEIRYGTHLPPDVVLKTGIPAKTEGDSYDLLVHQREFRRVDQDASERSALRGGCLLPIMPAKFAGEGGYVYVVKPLGGSVCIDQALGHKQVKGATGELEHSFGARQPGCQILGYHKVGAYSDLHEAYRLGPFVENPDANPR